MRKTRDEPHRRLAATNHLLAYAQPCFCTTAVIAILFLCGCSVQERAGTALFDGKGDIFVRKAMSIRDLDARISKLEEGIKAHPDKPEIHYQLAQEYSSRAGNLTSHYRTVEKNSTVTSYPKEVTKEHRAQAKKNYSQAIRECTRAIELAPEEDRYYMGRADMYWRSARIDDAIADLNKAVELSNSDNRIQKRAEYLCRAERFGQAMRDYDQLVSHQKKLGVKPIRHQRGSLPAWYEDPLVPLMDLYLERGRIEFLANNFGKAVTEFDTALSVRDQIRSRRTPRKEKGPFSRHVSGDAPQGLLIQLYVESAEALEKDGKYGEAATRLETAASVKGKKLTRHLNELLCKCYKRSNQKSKFEPLKSELIKTRGATTWYSKGLVLKNIGEYMEAVAAFKKSMSIMSNHYMTPHQLGHCYEELGDKKNALKFYSLSLTKNPEDFKCPPDALAPILLDRAQIYFDEGQYQIALDDLNKSIELDPDWSNSYRLRSRIFERIKQPDRSIEDKNRAFSLITSTKLNVGRSY